MTEQVKVAVAQLGVSADVAENGRKIRALVEQAARQGADIVQFPEAALSGYGGADVSSYREGYDWAALWAETEQVQAAAAAHGVRVLLGSTHFVSEDVAPTNCVYLLGPDGAIVDRYDKRMLTFSDQLYYTAGDHDVVFTEKGTTFGVQICYDICYPALYSHLVAQGVQVVLHSFYNAGFDGPNILDDVGPAWNIARAADNRVFVCAANASRAHQNWPSMVTRPDGSIAQQAERNQDGMILHTFPDEDRKGWEHNFRPFLVHPEEPRSMGNTSDHPRVQNRQAKPRP